MLDRFCIIGVIRELFPESPLTSPRFPKLGNFFLPAVSKVGVVSIKDQKEGMKMKLFAVSLFAVFAFSVVALAQNTSEKVISGGILNGKAISLPKPVYPIELKGSGASGPVKITVEINEEGKVISANPFVEEDDIRGYDEDGNVVKIEDNTANAHPVLQEAARQAALRAGFPPTKLSGVSVKVKGILIYNFYSPSATQTSSGPRSRLGGGGVLNGKAISLPKPAYPAAARAVCAEGMVAVQVELDEEGNVASASAVSGHPLLRSAAVEAAREAKFSPTTLQGEPVKVSGVIVYNFVAPDPEK